MTELGRRQAELEQLLVQLSSVLDGPDPPDGPRDAPGTHPSEEFALAAWLFGDFRIRLGRQDVDDWNGQRGQSILKYLVAHAPRAVSADALIDAFWPDTNPERARRSLHQAVYALRKTLRGVSDEQVVTYAHGHYQIDDQLTVWSDVHRFEHLLTEGGLAERRGDVEAMIATLDAAVSVYTGDFLEDSLYEEWTHPFREHLRNAFIRAGQRLARAFLDRHEVDRAISVANRILASDPCDEGAHRTLMNAFALQGQGHLVARQYGVCQDVLDEHLGIHPDAATTRLRDALLADHEPSA